LQILQGWTISTNSSPMRITRKSAAESDADNLSIISVRKACHVAQIATTDMLFYLRNSSPPNKTESKIVVVVGKSIGRLKQSLGTRCWLKPPFTSSGSNSRPRKGLHRHAVCRASRSLHIQGYLSSAFLWTYHSIGNKRRILRSSPRSTHSVAST
jgi:hypothetical protein